MMISIKKWCIGIMVLFLFMGLAIGRNVAYAGADISFFNNFITTVDTRDVELSNTLRSQPLSRSGSPLDEPVRLTLFFKDGKGYASLTSHFKTSAGTFNSKVLCSIWADEIVDNDFIAFGRGPSRSDVSVWGGNWGRTCSEFMVMRESDDTIHISAPRFDINGPMEGARLETSYRISHHIPVKPVDWSDPLLTSFEVKGKVLGPRDVMTLPKHILQKTKRKQTSAGSRLTTQSLLQSFIKPFTYLIGTPLEDESSALYEVRYTEGFQKIKPSFEQIHAALIERYGPVSAEWEGYERHFMIWAHDLSGQLITKDLDSCIPNKDWDWGSEMGPWHCGVVLWARLEHYRGKVSMYALKVYHGAGLANYVLSDGLQKIHEAKEQVEAEDSLKVKF